MRDLQRSQMGELNKTLIEATAVMKKLHSPKASLAKIEILVFLTAFLLIFLTIFGSLRRRLYSQKLKIVLWIAYTLSSYLITYTLGLMTESSFQNKLFPVWATFLMIFFGSSDSFSAYSLEDHEQWRTYSWQYLIKCFWLSLLLVGYGSTSPIILAVLFLSLLVPLKFSGRAASLLTGSGYGLERTTKLMADYMSSEHLSDLDDPNPILMRGYNYVVSGEEKRWVNRFASVIEKFKKKEAAALTEEPSYRKSLEITDEVITVEKVWKCQGQLLIGKDTDNKLKDICLSFSLYKLLSLRFCSYSLPKEAHEKVRKLFLDGLLAGEGGFERAFRVIELELSFLFDLFYTKYPIIYMRDNWIMKVVELLLLVIGSLATIGFCFTSYNSQDEVQLATSNGLSIDVLMTSLILMVFTCLEFVQLFFMAISEWTKVLLLCKYVRTNSWQENRRIEKLIGCICRMQLLKPWERELRQYSLLESHDYTPSKWLYNPVAALLIDLIRDGQKQSAPIELSMNVKRAVTQALMSNPGVLKNGETSLTLNMAGKLSWACGLETQTQVIFVWHIATSMCEHDLPIPDPDFDVATSLSKYLAYLVAFCPKLLPDHPYDAEYIFDEIILESRNLLSGCKTGEERIQKLKEIGSTMDDDARYVPFPTDSQRHLTGRVVNRGAQLGHQLLKKREDPKFIWKVLADFWAELMMYVAPSDNAKAHAEHLAMGGEFVTHLWALVSHASIKRVPSVERAPLSRSQSSPSVIMHVNGTGRVSP